MDELVLLTESTLRARGIRVGGNEYPLCVVRHGGAVQGPWGLRKRIAIQTRYSPHATGDDVTHQAYELDDAIDRALTETVGVDADGNEIGRALYVKARSRSDELRLIIDAKSKEAYYAGRLYFEEA